jgi:hypothetical protein
MNKLESFLEDILISFGIPLPIPFGIRKQVRQVKLISMITKNNSRIYCDAIYGSTRSKVLKNRQLCNKYKQRMRVLRKKAEKYKFKNEPDKKILFEMVEFAEKIFNTYGK